MYCLFCIFFIIIIPSFIVLLNGLYLNLQVLLFVHSPPHPTVGKEEQVSTCVVLVASCWVKLTFIYLLHHFQLA